MVVRVVVGMEAVAMVGVGTVVVEGVERMDVVVGLEGQQPVSKVA